MNTILQKRIEEKSKELAQKYFPNEMNIWARPNYEAQYVESACKEIATFALQNQWISVEEGLPNIDGNGYSNPVLVKCRLHPNDNIVATYSSLSNLWLSDGLRLEVTHWMSIPSLEGGKK